MVLSRGSATATPTSTSASQTPNAPRWPTAWPRISAKAGYGRRERPRLLTDISEPLGGSTESAGWTGGDGWGIFPRWLSEGLSPCARKRKGRNPLWSRRAVWGGGEQTVMIAAGAEAWAGMVTPRRLETPGRLLYPSCQDQPEPARGRRSLRTRCCGRSADFSRPLPGEAFRDARPTSLRWRREFLEVPGLGRARAQSARHQVQQPHAAVTARGYAGLARSLPGRLVQEVDGLLGPANSPDSEVCAVLAPRLPGARYSSPALPSLRRVAGPRQARRSGSFKKITVFFSPSGLGNSRDSQVGVVFVPRSPGTR